MGDEPFEPAEMIAVAVAQDQAVDPARIEVEQFEVADQHLGRVAEIEQILRPGAGLRRFEVQRQAPLAGKGRALMAGDMADMLDADHRVGGIGDEPVVSRVDQHPDREAIDDRGGKRFCRGQSDAHCLPPILRPLEP